MEITKVALPSKDDLSELIQEALQDGKLTPAEFITNHCKGTVATLQKDPALYRAYGAYWWAVKRILNEQGYGEFVGSDIEEISADHFSLEDDATTLCAAWYYWNDTVNSGYQYNPIHVYSYEDDGDFVQFEYSIEDEGMESKVFNS
ncbi:TPA: hypothetical protein ACVU5P_004244 [Vibrio parahaemolyticus]